MHGSSSPIMKYGISSNKIFDYFAAGKPILCDFDVSYNPIADCNAGICLSTQTPKSIADAILYFVHLSKNEYKQYCKNALNASQEYNFDKLTEKLIEIME